MAEGQQKDGRVCSTIDAGLISETIARNNNNKLEEFEFSRNLLSRDTAKGTILPDLTLESKMDKHLFDPEVITGTIKDQSGNPIEQRISTLSSNLIDANTIDTQILDGHGKLKGSIHSTMPDAWGVGQVDTIVKDAAGQTLRHLDSQYNSNLTEPDTFCTRLK
jgi:hypothetical protein